MLLPLPNLPILECSGGELHRQLASIADDDGCDDHEDATTDAAFPTLRRTDARKQLVLAEKRTAAISTRIIGPEEDEDAQRQEHVIMYLTIECRMSQMPTR